MAKQGFHLLHDCDKRHLITNLRPATYSAERILKQIVQITQKLVLIIDAMTLVMEQGSQKVLKWKIPKTRKVNLGDHSESKLALTPR